MSDTDTQSDFLDELKQELRDIQKAIGRSYRAFGVNLRNSLRRMRRARLDYVIFPIDGLLPERDLPPRSFIERQLPLPPPPLTLETLNRRLQAVADADNVKGVIFVFRGFSAGLATLQNFRQAVLRLRQAGKETIVYTPYLDGAHIFTAVAADRIIIPPSAQFDFLGLRTEALYFKESLAQVGVQAEVVQISPYKTAYDNLDKRTMTPQQREQLNWLLDEQFDLIVDAIADGRDLPRDQVEALIDRAPLFAEDALDAGLVDALAYEDELLTLLAESEEAEADEPPRHDEAAETEDPTKENGRLRANIKAWSDAQPLLLEKQRHISRKYIGVISLEGLIVMGSSRRPPVDLPIPLLGGVMAGETTLIKLLRRAEQADDMAALILYVNSGGGSALASDLIAREVQRIQEKKPVIAYMGDVAASGGYYVSAPARHIMCQPGTVTGSIGVITLKLSTSGLYDKLHINRVSLERGEHAGLYSSSDLLSEKERELLWEGVMDNYRRFKQFVADGRDIPFDQLDPICEGRVWSGRQARERSLTDSFGDFQDAVRRAAALADLPYDDAHTIPTVNLHPKDENPYVVPQPAAALNAIGRFLLGEQLKEFQGKPLLLMPFHIRFKN